MQYVDSTKVGERIKNRRKELGLTQSNLTEKTSIAETSISGYENGKGCDLETLANIALALNTGLDYLAFGNEGTITPVVKDQTEERKTTNALNTLFMQGYFEYDDSDNDQLVSICLDRKIMEKYIKELDFLTKMSDSLSDETLKSVFKDIRKVTEENLKTKNNKRKNISIIAKLSKIF